ncbi:hypothetical protein GCM10011348_14000 [Marinobacterium nitratireducens]|uniref:Twin-arginine translocation pathway signal sequence domain-containing protein n=1 Tax=Marinobacterium nitratireducens TaxID=518897 RepID=A0A918DR28_9GAMM|nr:DUF1501 domain-containing protein [Marinobacterium nitratireducens]GGO79521.1 hypothetical protein GCM10011348_14000 [Marinobacterium nitratireducens]
MNRRSLLQYLTLMPLLGPAGLSAASREASSPPVLLLVELNGGNDSLNTVVPLEQLAAYQHLRPNLGLNADERLDLDEQYALNLAFEPLLPVWEAGNLALVHGLGYPQPNRSHFRAIEIWDTASGADEFRDEGWLAAPSNTLGSSELDALVFGRNAAAFAGGGCRFLVIDNLKSFLAQSRNIEKVVSDSSNPAMRRVIDARYRIQAGEKLLSGVRPAASGGTSPYPASAFGRQLADAASVIRADLGVPVLKLSLGSFDTHRNQKQTHARLLRHLARGLAALRSELKTSGHWERVLVVTYSEFGRRASENGSGGTDHGTAATHFVLGGRVRGGHYGHHPSLVELADRDMQFTTDFRRLYQTVLTEWWQQPDLRVPGDEWETLGLIG